MIDMKINSDPVSRWARASQRAPKVFRSELIRTTNGLLAEGIGLAEENAPVDNGDLRASIQVVQAAVVSSSSVKGSYGPIGIIYARIQEFGGVIRAKAAPWLVFKTRDGNWVKVKSVTITGIHYLAKSKRSLQPRARKAYQLAVTRTLKTFGG